MGKEKDIKKEEFKLKTFGQLLKYISSKPAELGAENYVEYYLYDNKFSINVYNGCGKYSPIIIEHDGEKKDISIYLETEFLSDKIYDGDFNDLNIIMEMVSEYRELFKELWVD